MGARRQRLRRFWACRQTTGWVPSSRRLGESARQSRTTLPKRTCAAAYHQFTVQVENRDTASQELKKQAIGSAVCYPIPLHLQKVHAHLGYKPDSTPNAGRAAERCLSPPMFPGISEEQIERVVDALRSAMASANRTETSAQCVALRQ
jgi:dTDP-4-amino-4,6-dideoxygalactose transaminase